MASDETRQMLIVATHDGDGSNLDLMVEARDQEQALKLWADHYEGADLPPPEAVRVFLVPPLTNVPHVVRWHQEMPVLV